MLILLLGAVLVVAIWLCLSPRVFPALYNRHLFHPGKERGNQADLMALAHKIPACRRSFVNGRGNRLTCWFFGDRDKLEKVYLYSMGKDGDIARRCEMISLLVDSGACVFIYEYAGYGTSEGKPSYLGLLGDAQDAYDYLTGELKIAPERIVLFGESLGGAVSCWLLNKRKVAGIVLKSAFASLRQVAVEKIPLLRLYPTWLFPQPQLDNEQALASSSVPALVVHGDGDRMIDRRHPRRLIEAAAGPKWLVSLPESRHSFMTDEDKIRFREGLTRFLSELKTRA